MKLVKFVPLCKIKGQTYCFKIKNNQNFRTAVQVQAETMVNTTQEKFDQCLKLAETKVPATTPFVENVKKCVKPTRNNEEVEEVITEEDAKNDVIN